MAQRGQDRRAEETEEQRNSRLSDMAQRGQERRAEETEEQRNSRLPDMARRSQQRRAEETEEQRKENTFWGERNVYGMTETCRHFENRKQTPSEVAQSITNSEHIENIRNYVRKDVTTNRRNCQLRAVNLNRGLVMEEDSQGASKSDLTFDLTSLVEALPPVSRRSKKAPGMKRSFKLQGRIINNMKENRALRHAATGSLSLNAATVEANN
ncbi:hypothetical protein AVEN_25245-1 [Araneus ventricosus]|uniref:STPR domain-containing protein n=1 Tax=Araneus ventricosus TaxID=182803 RepID=A0A4Y2T675_ARAVE|nr:hypothetical protein AVEN_25245-1 [Araneus ventricosus]